MDNMPQRRGHHRHSKSGTLAFIPHDIIKRPKLVELATRLNMTPSQQASYTMTLIEEAKGDAALVSTSYATAGRDAKE